LTKYKKINNQSATYQPGVDVNGNAVTPANLPSDGNAPAPIFQNVTKVPLTVDLAEKIASLSGRGLEMNANFGLLSIHPDGRVTFGDDDMTSDVKTACGIAHEVKEEVMVETTIVETPAPMEVKPVEATTPKEPEKEPEVTTKIISNKPELVPETLQGGAYR